MARDEVGIDVAEDRQPTHRRGAGQRDLEEAGGGLELRRLAAALKERDAELRRETGGQDVDGEAGDDLVAAVGDGGKPVQQGEDGGCDDGGGEAGPG